jgi:hypothetical protein
MVLCGDARTSVEELPPLPLCFVNAFDFEGGEVDGFVSALKA